MDKSASWKQSGMSWCFYLTLIDSWGGFASEQIAKEASKTSSSSLWSNTPFFVEPVVSISHQLEEPKIFYGNVTEMVMTNGYIFYMEELEVDNPIMVVAKGIWQDSEKTLECNTKNSHKWGQWVCKEDKEKFVANIVCLECGLSLTKTLLYDKVDLDTFLSQDQKKDELQELTDEFEQFNQIVNQLIKNGTVTLNTISKGLGYLLIESGLMIKQRGNKFVVERNDS